MSQVLPPVEGSKVSSAAPLPVLRHVRVAGVDWESVLDFTQLFRGFRLAINPAKILIALLAILLIYTAGRTFDFAWGPQVRTGEIESFRTDSAEQYRTRRQEQLSSRTADLDEALQLASSRDTSITLEQIAALKGSPRAAYRVLKRAYEARFHEDVNDARDRRVKAEADETNHLAPLDGESPKEAEQDERAAAAKALFERVERTKEMVGQGIFDSFLSYEIRQFDALVDNTLTFVRVSPVRTTSSGAEIEGEAVSGGLLSKNPERVWQSDTVVGCLANMAITGPEWLFCGTAPMQWRSGAGVVGFAMDAAPAATWTGWAKMVIYRGAYLASLILLAVFSLVVMALTGAILSRLSALEMAGAEHSPLMEVFGFAVRRLWVFVKAPITPFLILLAIGVMLAVAGLIGAIPFLGEIVLGMAFILFLAVGFVLMLLLLGILGGFHLLYPTIAVEGSDAFDAMSRSFAYVYARPWRLLFYSVISLIYGVVTFLFVSFAIYLVLSLTHTFAGWGTSFFGYNHGWYSGSAKLDTLWPAPEFSRLLGATNWYAMNWSEFVGSLFLHFWVYLLISAGGAYVISYYFSTHTIIYLLLRRSVDGQTTTEVFMDDAGPNARAPLAQTEAGAAASSGGATAPTGA
jgi:hypothetical protein